MQDYSNKAKASLEIVFNKAPKDTGNLQYSMQSTPTISGDTITIKLGEEWQTRAKKSSNYNYGQLLNDKRVIKNRESSNDVKRLQNRRIRSEQNTRNHIVKDTRNGKILRMSGRQYEVNMNKRKKGELPNFVLQNIDYNIPIKKSTIPYRVNRHYHYLNDLCSSFPNTFAQMVGGTLHRGDYNPSKRKTTKEVSIKEMKKYLIDNNIRGFEK